jgi:hypothetical protein
MDPDPASKNMHWILFLYLKAVLGIRIRMFEGLPDPDSLVRGKDPDPSDFSKVLSRLKKCLQNIILTKNLIFKTEDNVPAGKL